MRSARGKSAGTASSRVRNCDERHKWKFGTLDYKSIKPTIFTFSAFYVISGNLKLRFLQLEFWIFHISKNCVK